ncbi:ankyrin repeat domain-containing protein [Brachyspira catarrhinii]|uniref:Ankyrin repeat domain-containing protein n=1 Tax=Brachyspira catarrhinii TaxID=2528966 RepID=A0ABY2TSR2_9SPIR|nr:ankyrin repeat domain-containing protein [Brachyspira catarrhinii]TKZ34322.1 ankyrin repeat domain-containing protein [Brachyspira catarrhinii]
MNKKLLKLLFTFLILTLFISCKKENETVEEENIYDTYVKGNPNNIYHKKYTNVVKIQGRYVEKTNNSFYLALGGREEGEYDENYNIFEAIRFGSLQRVAEIIESDSSQIESELDNDGEEEYNKFTEGSYIIDGVNPLSLAVFYRDMGIFQYLLDNINDESVLLHGDVDGWNAFAYACAFGTVDIIKALIQKYPDFVNWENSYGANGLHMAALQGNVSVFDYLVNDLKMDINATDDDGRGVLYYAKSDETKEALEKLRAIVENDYNEDESE